MIKYVIATVVLSFSFSPPVSASDYESPPYTCPTKIAYHENDDLATDFAQKLKNIYIQLNCSTRFIALPARRGLAEFNAGTVDGEIYRLTLIEKHYKQSYIRSRLPLTIINSSLFENPEEKVAKRRPIGYLRGVAWMEEYPIKRKKVVFNNFSSMFQAYERKAIGGFLAADNAVAQRIASGELQNTPQKIKTVISMHLYHYLKPEYGDFLEVLSSYVEHNRPFDTK